MKVYGSPRYVRKVPRGVFKPIPKVDSAILVVENISNKNFNDLDEDFFFTIVRAGFAQKRKMLLNNLSGIAPRERLVEVFQELSLNEKVRAEDVPLSLWLSLTQQLSKLK